MQINSISSPNFGVKFSPRFQKAIEAGIRKHTADGNESKAYGLKNLYLEMKNHNDNCLLDIGQDKFIIATIPIKEQYFSPNKTDKYPEYIGFNTLTTLFSRIKLRNEQLDNITL